MILCLGNSYNRYCTSLKFLEKFIIWMMACVTAPPFSLGVNGENFGFFKGQGGFRQGDPISPFLFVICMEYLSRSLRKATLEDNFNYHPKCKN